ncbi:esterase family protein [Catenovulum sp. SM1970]|uniref:alpha/beta hydrolase n=1 Tax=Marinifaba aquimaris TaxID=2741323 RepID=UPI00157452C4|nr:alpha/beta hydrolase family protein [Marinifaba aquimaris]NTS78152.1 esterase family protein [Marinifaba aquimaris]
MMKKLRQLFIAISLMSLTFPLFAYQTYLHEFVGQTTKIRHPVAVVVPDAYLQAQQQKQAKAFKVVYLLHGYGGDYRNWFKATDVEKYADLYQFILVAPDGNRNSWYINSKLNPASQYQSYIAKDLVTFIDDTYSTQRNDRGRAITGLSMGGFGALHIAINNQMVFGAAGSTSGGVDFTPFPNNWDINKHLGRYSSNQASWHAMSIKNNLDKLQGRSLRVIIDVGVSDFFLQVNRQLHQAMLQANLNHTYIEMPGKHNFAYWQKSIGYQMKFFAEELKD